MRPLRTNPSPWPEKSRDDPELYPPPWMNTITGKGDPPASRTGACTFTLRQSSSARMTLVAGRTRRFEACGATAPNTEASRIPRHGSTGAGALNRRSAIGGAAYGMPRHARIQPSRTPRTTPPVTRTSSPSSVPGCAVIPARTSSPHSIPAASAAPDPERRRPVGRVAAAAYRDRAFGSRYASPAAALLDRRTGTHSDAVPHANPSGSVNDPASPLIRMRCDPVPSGATPASLASARRL